MGERKAKVTRLGGRRGERKGASEWESWELVPEGFKGWELRGGLREDFNRIFINFMLMIPNEIF